MLYIYNTQTHTSGAYVCVFLTVFACKYIHTHTYTHIPIHTQDASTPRQVCLYVCVIVICDTYIHTHAQDVHVFMLV